MTLKEVARLAGVSPSAVSRYLNGGPLSEEKSVSIREVIRQTGYVPNQAAHTLRTGRVRQVGVVVPRIHSEAVSKVTAGITEVLDRRCYLPALGCTGRDLVQETRYLEMMRAYHVAGVILMATSVSEPRNQLYRSYSLPLVVTGQRIPGVNCVYHDDYHAMRELTALFLRRGRRRLCFIGVEQGDAAVGIERLRGARDALSDAGLSLLGTETAGFDWESGFQCMRRLLDAHPDTDGVLCATDTIAHGAMLALREAGRRVPEDVSVAGVGDDWADLISIPRLTAAQLDQRACGREAASILLDLLERRDADGGGDEDGGPRQVCLGYSIVDRGSV